jgi:peptidoglycan/LPS O-acetylase OafA/YrhL
MQQATRRSLDALTGARFLAALWVVVYHYTLEFRFPSLKEALHYQYGHHTPFDLLILQGHLAVDFFFLLSGFILAYTYISDSGRLRGSPRAFWVARIARIYPVYLLGLALAFYPYATAQDGPIPVLESGAAHLLMLHTWFPQTLAWNQPS